MRTVKFLHKYKLSCNECRVIYPAQLVSFESDQATLKASCNFCDSEDVEVIHQLVAPKEEKQDGF